MGHPKVLLLGAGFGGLRLAYKLRKAQVDLTVVDRTNHHLFQPLLYQVATSALAPRDIAYPIREILKRQENTTVIMDEAVQIETDKRIVHFASQKSIAYDYLVIAVGAHQSYFGHNEWAPYAPGLKTLQDAIEIRRRILLAFEQAEVCNSREEAQKLLTFVIVGGGPTGAELAGAIAEIAHHTMLKNFRHIDPRKTQVYLIEGQDRILPTFPPYLSGKAKEELTKLGVKVLTSTFVKQIDAQTIHFGDQHLPTSQVFWAAGNMASSLLKTLGTALDRQNRVKVNPDLSIPGHPELFVIGDAAFVLDEKKRPLPGVAPVAIQQGTYVARLIAKNIPISKRPAFRYKDKGSMATIGKGKAVVEFGKRQFSGFIAWLVWSLVHIVFLIGFRNRIMVMMEWLFWYITEQRSSRLIIEGISTPEEKDKPE